MDDECINPSLIFSNIHFDPTTLTKEEERLFYGERVSEVYIPFDTTGKSAFSPLKTGKLIKAYLKKIIIKLK